MTDLTIPGPESLLPPDDVPTFDNLPPTSKGTRTSRMTIATVFYLLVGGGFTGFAVRFVFSIVAFATWQFIKLATAPPSEFSLETWKRVADASIQLLGN